jgi:hypothetical protein
MRIMIETAPAEMRQFADMVCGSVPFGCGHNLYYGQARAFCVSAEFMLHRIPSLLETLSSIPCRCEVAIVVNTRFDVEFEGR